MKTTTQNARIFTSFIDTVVLVAGKATPLSMGIIHAFLLKKATVIVPLVSLHEIDKLKAYKNNGDYGTLVTMLTDLPDFAKAAGICEAIVEKYGKIDISVGVRNEQKCDKLLTDVSGDEWEAMIDCVVTPFFVHARVTLNVLKQMKKGLFVSVGAIIFPESEELPALTKIELAITRQLSKLFAQEAYNAQVGYHHLYVSSEVDGKLPDEKSIGEKTGELIMELYLKNGFNSEFLFEILYAGETPLLAVAPIPN